MTANNTGLLPTAVKDIYQHRTPEEDAFRERTGWLVSHMDSFLVTDYYGIGGIGKSWFLEYSLKPIVRSRGRACISYPFTDNLVEYEIDMITKVAVQIGKHYRYYEWPATRTMLTALKVDDSILDNDTSSVKKILGAVDDMTSIKKSIGGYIAEKLPGIGHVKKLVEGIGKIIEQIEQEDTAVGKGMDRQALIKMLVASFALDVSILMDEKEEPMVIFLDAVEKLKKESDDQWLRDLIRHTCGIHWVLAGRDKLKWETDRIEGEYWKQEIAEGIKRKEDRELKYLDEDDVRTYFLQSHVTGTYDAELGGYLYRVTYGHPLYMRLCVDIASKALEFGKEVNEDIFADTPEGLIRNWAITDDANGLHIQRFAQLYNWNETALKECPILNPEAGTWYNRQKSSSIFQKTGRGNVQFHDVIQEVMLKDGFMNNHSTAEQYMDQLAEWFERIIVDEKVNKELLYVALASQMYYLQLKGDYWCTGSTDRNRSIKALFRFCKKLDDIGDYQEEYRLSSIMLGYEAALKQKNDVALLYSWYAYACNNLGYQDKALEYFQKDLRIREEVLGPDHPDTAKTYNNIGSVYGDMGDYGKALEYFQKDLRISEKLLGPNHPSTAGTYCSIGEVYRAMGDYDKALEYLQKALKINEEVPELNHPSTAAMYNNIGLVYIAMGNYDKALEYLQKALRIGEEVMGPDHPNTATIYNNIGGIYEDMGDNGKALEYYQKALKIREETLGRDHSLTALTYNNIGLVYKDMGDYGKALEYYQNDLRISEKVHGPDHPDIATTYNNIGGVYRAMGDYGRALEYYQKALKICEEVLGQDHPSTATTYNNIGLLAVDTGDYQKSVNHLFKAFRVYESVFGENHPNTQTISGNLRGVLNSYSEQGSSLADLDEDVIEWMKDHIADGTDGK